MRLVLLDATHSRLCRPWFFTGMIKANRGISIKDYHPPELCRAQLGTRTKRE
jgi:hypothetical protein